MVVPTVQSGPARWWDPEGAGGAIATPTDTDPNIAGAFKMEKD